MNGVLAMSKVYLKNKRLPECCKYTIDRETGEIQHEKECPQRMVHEALVVMCCIIVALLILALGYMMGQGN